MAEVSDLRVSTEQAARQARQLGLWARVVLVPVAVIGAVLSFQSLYQAAVPTFGEYLAGGFPLLVDLLILGASLQYVAGAKIGRPMAGWRLTAHAGVAGTLVLNALAAKELGEVPWHITAPAVWAVLVELTAKQVLGEWKATHTARADTISLPLWMTAPFESTRTRLLMFRTGITDAHQARIAVGVNAAAREALRLALPKRNARRVRRIINRQLRAGSLTPVAILRPLGWTQGGVILSNPRPDVILQAVLQEVLDPGAPPRATLDAPAAPPVARPRVASVPSQVAHVDVELPETEPEFEDTPEVGAQPRVTQVVGQAWNQPDGPAPHPAAQQFPDGQHPAAQQFPAAQQYPAAQQPAAQQYPAASYPAAQRHPVAPVTAAQHYPAAQQPVAQQYPAAQQPVAQQYPAAQQPMTAPRPEPMPQPQPGPTPHFDPMSQPDMAIQSDATQPAEMSRRPGTVQQPARALQLGRALHRGRVLHQTGSPDGSTTTAEQLRSELSRLQTPRFGSPQVEPTAVMELDPAEPSEQEPRIPEQSTQPQPAQSAQPEPQVEQVEPFRRAEPQTGPWAERSARPVEPFLARTAVLGVDDAGQNHGRPGAGAFSETEILEDMEHLDDLDGQYPNDFDGLDRDDYIDLDTSSRQGQPVPRGTRQ
jgi:hypothetical protein